VTPDEIERALKQTPLPRGVALVMMRDDISRPRLLPATAPGAWLAEIYLARKNGLPLYWPRAANRPRPTRFLASIVTDNDPLVNMLRIENAAAHLVAYAKEKLRRRALGLKGSRTLRKRGAFTIGPGRPRGILRSMEKTGSNRDRNCVSCGRRHRRSPCQEEGPGGGRRAELLVTACGPPAVAAT